MNRKTTEVDRSRNGFLIHSAKASGRHLTIAVYIEGIEDPRLTIESNVLCRTQEQAAELARVLTEATFPTGLTETIAAYLLDRADQYVDDSACHVALIDAAHNILRGDATERGARGEFDDSGMKKRLTTLKRASKIVGSRAVDSKAGVDDE